MHVRCLVFLFLLMAVAATAQEARLTGTITDPSGAVVAGAQITATHKGRNVDFKATSDTSGRFLFPRLPIGNYEVRVGTTGFKTFTQSNVNLTTDADSLLNIILPLGDVTQEVTVSAEATRVSTQSATFQQLVDTRRVVDLPLNGRDVYQLATLVTGVGQSGTNISGGRNNTQNSSMVNVRVDGALNTDDAWGIMLPVPSPDATQEFTIQTSVPSAKYGFASGVVEVSTRSGTNALHGTLYEFLRNDKLDARNFFLPNKTKRKRNQFGFAGGGPVYLPLIYDGRNKTFWFLNVEDQREALGGATTIYVPTEAELGGDFSAISRAIKDPLTNKPFPNNQIPRDRLDTLALNFAKHYLPQAQDTLGTYVYQQPLNNDPWQVLLRGDQILRGGGQQLSGRMFITRNSQAAGAGNLPYFQNGINRTETDLYGITHTWTLSPNKINTARFGFNGYYQSPAYEPTSSIEDLKKLGFADNWYSYVPYSPNLNVSGYFQNGVAQIRTSRDFGTFSWSDDFSWIRGVHNLQFGMDALFTLQTADNYSRTQGMFTFSGTFSSVALTDFLVGRPASFQQDSPAPSDVHGRHFAWYVQDDIKVNRRLSVTLGLRHELPRPTIAQNNKAIHYQPGAQSQVYLNAPPGLLFYGDPGVPRAGREASTKLFAPRVGLAYILTADQKTTFRSGYGVYYNPSWTNIEGQFPLFQPFTRSITIVAPPSTSNPWQGYPGGNPHPYTPGPDSVFDREIRTLTYGPNFTELMMQQWNASVQREFGSNWLATIGYVGTHGTHVPYERDANPAIYIPGASTVANTNSRRPLYPYFAQVLSIESVINSSYNSLQASLDKRFSKGFTVLASYTFSKALTDLNTVLTQGAGEQNPNDRHAEWAPADFDRTHALVTSWVWQVPYGTARQGVARALFGDWAVNGIWSMYSGAPLSFTLSQDRALRGQPNRPDRIKDPRLSNGRSRAEQIVKYFDTSAFVPNATGQFGSAPRAEGQLRAPGTANVTLGVQKKLRGFAESHSLLFRSEFFNVLNRPNFGPPGTNPDSLSSYGRITSAADGRIIQFGMKYIF